LAYFHGSSLAELIWNSDSTLRFVNAAAIRNTFDFLQATARSVEEARGVPFCEERQELMQNTGNEEHTRGKRADLRPGVGGAHVEPRAWCQLPGISGVTRPSYRVKEGVRTLEHLAVAAGLSELPRLLS